MAARPVAATFTPALHAEGVIGYRPGGRQASRRQECGCAGSLPSAAASSAVARRWVNDHGHRFTRRESVMIEVAAVGALLAPTLPYLPKSADQVATQAAGAGWRDVGFRPASLGQGRRTVEGASGGAGGDQRDRGSPTDEGLRGLLDHELGKLLAADAALEEHRRDAAVLGRAPTAARGPSRSRMTTATESRAPRCVLSSRHHPRERALNSAGLVERRVVCATRGPRHQSHPHGRRRSRRLPSERVNLPLARTFASLRALTVRSTRRLPRR